MIYGEGQGQPVFKCMQCICDRLKNVCVIVVKFSLQFSPIGQGKTTLNGNCHQLFLFDRWSRFIYSQISWIVWYRKSSIAVDINSHSDWPFFHTLLSRCPFTDFTLGSVIEISRSPHQSPEDTVGGASLVANSLTLRLVVLGLQVSSRPDLTSQVTEEVESCPSLLSCSSHSLHCSLASV